MGYTISTCQMQYDAADKKTDQEDPCFISCNNVAPTDFGSWSEIQRDAIPADDTKRES